MKILHIGKYYPPFMGGIENFMADLLPEQSRQGHQVAAIVHHHEKHLPYLKEVIHGCAIHRVPFYGQMAYAPISPSFGSYLNQVICEFSPDVIHIHMPNLSAIWCLFSSQAKTIPWVVHWHADVIGAVPDLKIKVLYPMYACFENRILDRSTKVIATSPPYLSSSLPLQKFRHKTTVIPLGINISAKPFQCLATRSTKGSGTRLRLLVIGRLTYYKGHRYLLEAVAQLCAEGLNVHLDIVGGGELEAEIKQQVLQLELAANVHCLGKLSDDDLHTALHSCDLICLPSIERTEAFGVVLLEAARVEKPALVTDVSGSGMSWVVQSGVTGLVAKAGDVASLAQQLRMAYDARDSLHAMGKAAKQRLNENFDISVISSKITALCYC
ncbi:glycosyltransferase [Motilimonas pumila]|uniref:Glycosyltransferase n=1 Tax=Motilimonas pumila TaxID=2303987 RepID=A0A418YDU6_9GAMM|nr:glycosyltransferase [Motilimonas pumila]RJG42717.1 glycosyltransferase [Motilimonas pumila]